MTEIRKNIISVITVCYNAKSNLEKTILSVLNQTYSNIEYIIIDGGSTDGTIDIIKRYDDKITYWQSEPDKLYECWGFVCIYNDFATNVRCNKAWSSYFAWEYYKNIP